MDYDDLLTDKDVLVLKKLYIKFGKEIQFGKNVWQDTAKIWNDKDLADYWVDDFAPRMDFGYIFSSHIDDRDVAPLKDELIEYIMERKFYEKDKKEEN